MVVVIAFRIDPCTSAIPKLTLPETWSKLCFSSSFIFDSGILLLLYFFFFFASSARVVHGKGRKERERGSATHSHTKFDAKVQERVYIYISYTRTWHTHTHTVQPCVVLSSLILF